MHGLRQHILSESMSPTSIAPCALIEAKSGGSRQCKRRSVPSPHGPGPIARDHNPLYAAGLAYAMLSWGFATCRFCGRFFAHGHVIAARKPPRMHSSRKEDSDEDRRRCTS